MMNWKLLILDLLAAASVIAMIIWWNGLSTMQQFTRVIVCAAFIGWRISDHYRFYREQKRVY